MKCRYYYIFFSNLFVSLLFTQHRNPKVLGLGPQGPECKLNPYWSKLRVREKHDVMLFSFFTCPLIPKTLLTQKSDSIFVHRLLRYSIFPHIYLRFLFPQRNKLLSHCPVQTILAAIKQHWNNSICEQINSIWV